MKIEFSTLAGKTCLHEVDDSLVVAAVKEQLYAPLEIDPLDEVRLFNGTIELHDAEVVGQPATAIQVVVQSTPTRAQQFLSKYQRNSENMPAVITFSDVQDAAKALSRLNAHLGREGIKDFLRQLTPELVIFTLPLWEGWPTGPEITPPGARFQQCALGLHPWPLDMSNYDFPGSITPEHLEESFRCLWKGYSPGAVCTRLQTGGFQFHGDDPVMATLQLKSFHEHGVLQLERLIQGEADVEMRRRLAQTISSLVTLPVCLPLFGLDEQEAFTRTEESLQFCCRENYDEPSSRHTAAVVMAMAMGDKLQEMEGIVEACSVHAASEEGGQVAAVLASMLEGAKHHMRHHLHAACEQSPLQPAEGAWHVSKDDSSPDIQDDVQDKADDVDDISAMHVLMDETAPVNHEPEESDPLAEEQADLSKAIMLSKADIPPELSADGVVVYRLDRRVGSPEVQAVLMQAEALTGCRRAVLEAGCDLQPEWANGAWIFIPMTKEVFQESKLELTSKDVLMLSSDEAAVKSALRELPGSCRKRPKLRPVLPGDRLPKGEAELTRGLASSSNPTSTEQEAAENYQDAQESAGQRKRHNDDEPEVVQCRTFYELSDRFASLSLSSGRSCRSAP